MYIGASVWSSVSQHGALRRYQGRLVDNDSSFSFLQLTLHALISIMQLHRLVIVLRSAVPDRIAPALLAIAPCSDE